MLRIFLPLTLAATLLAPLAVSADTAVSPAPPTAPAAPKHHNHMGGIITAVDAAKKTVTINHHDKDKTLTIADDAKIYKIGDLKGSPTGTFADLTVGTLINAHLTGDEATPTANEVHIRKPKSEDKKPEPPATVPPTPATPQP